MPPVDMFDAVERMVSIMDRRLPVRIEPGTVPSLHDQKAVLEYLRSIENEYAA